MNKTIPSFVFLWLACLIAKAEVPRPEHPRPDAFRENWLSLNGPWQFEIDKAGDGEARGLISGKDLASTIIVPFCPESKLSGLGLGNTEYFKHVWYRRTFELPASMKGKRVLLHFGGVDYKTWVYVNGQLAGTHTGENAAVRFRDHATTEGRLERIGGPRVRRSPQRPAGRRQAGATTRAKAASIPAPRASGSRCGWKPSARRSSKASRSCPIRTTAAC